MAQTVTSTTTAKVLKALGVFGGVQVATILCSIIRTKLVALWIGPAGVGLITLYNSTIELLSNTTQLNLRQSAVRDIAAADDTGRMIAVVRRLALVLGTAGMVLVAASSPLLSRLTFGDSTHTIAFAILSAMMLLSAVASGEWAVMQATGQLRVLARSTLLASVTATAAAIPLFYFMRSGGIVPVLVVFAASNCVYALAFRTAGNPQLPPAVRQLWNEGRGMLALGFYMTVSMGLTLLASYIFAVWLNRIGGEDAVGIYQAGYTLVNSYVGMIFTAISMEYYPRLTSVAASTMRTEVVVSHEIKIALWLLMPVTALFIGLKGLMVDILYSPGFHAALPYISLAIIGVGLRGASWCMAYVILARGDGRIYVFTELTSAAAYLALNIPLYLHWGYAGLGLAYIGWYAVYTAICYGVYRLRYRLHLRHGIVPLLLSAIAVGALSLYLDTTIGIAAPIGIAVLAAIAAYRAIIRKRNNKPYTL